MNYKNTNVVSRVDKLPDRKCFRKQCTNNKLRGYNYSFSQINSFINKIEIYLVSIYGEEQRFLKYGFGKIPKKDPKLEQKLNLLLKTLYDYRKSIVKNYDSSICVEEINNILSLSKQLMDSYRPKFTLYSNKVDIESKVDILNIDNKCVSYESWERALHIKLPKFNVTAKNVEHCKGFMYDVLVKTRGNTDKECFLYNVSASVKNVCDPTYTVTVKDKTCKIKYDLLVRKIPNCTISYDVYAKLIKDGFDDELIEQLQELSIDVQLNENNKYSLITSEGNKYSLSSLQDLNKITNIN